MVKQGFLNLSYDEQKRVIDSALQEFSSKDYETASMNQIIQNAGISKGSMYHYFQHKEDLYIYLIDRVMEEKKEYLTKALKRLDKPYQDLGFFEILKLQLDSSILFAYENPQYFFLGMQLNRMPESQLKERIWGRMAIEFDLYMDHMIQSAVEAGEIRKDMDVRFVKRLIKFMLLNFTDLYSDSEEMRNLNLPVLEKEMEQLVEFLKTGLQAK